MPMDNPRAVSDGDWTAKEITDVYASTWERVALLPVPAGAAPVAQFAHLADDTYAASYYSFVFCQVRLTAHGVAGGEDESRPATRGRRGQRREGGGRVCSLKPFCWLSVC